MQHDTKSKHPIARSVAYTLLILIFPVAAGIIITILQSSDTQALLIQAALFALAFACAALISKVQYKSLAAVGLRKPAALQAKRSLYFIPLVLVESLAFVGGVQPDLNAATVGGTLLFMLFVALAEETFFRGIILTQLKSKSLVLGLLLSSVLFSLGHLSNLAAGKDVFSTLLQVAFAFAFGLVAAMLALQTKSLVLPVMLHFVHNCLATLMAAPQSGTDNLLAGAQTLILLAYALYLWKNNKAWIE